MSIKLTREQELKLINLGLEYLLSFQSAEAHSNNIEEKPKKRQWTDEQRRKFRKTMKAKYAAEKQQVQK